MNLNLKGKYGLVTGAGHGIGRAIALVLAQEGCNVAICSIDKQQVDDVVNEVKAKGVDSIGIQADATVLEDIERAIKTIIGDGGVLLLKKQLKPFGQMFIIKTLWRQSVLQCGQFLL